MEYTDGLRERERDPFLLLAALMDVGWLLHERESLAIGTYPRATTPLYTRVVSPRGTIKLLGKLAAFAVAASVFVNSMA